MEYTAIEYPEHVFNIKEIRALSVAIDIEMEKLGIELDNMDLDTSIEESTERGIARREKILGIVPYDTATLEDRRQVVATLWSDRAVYTEEYLRRYLARTIGESNYRLTVDYTNQTFKLLISLENKILFGTVKDFMEKIVPLHVTLDVDLLYNTWGKIPPRTWDDVDEQNWSHWKSDVL